MPPHTHSLLNDAISMGTEPKEWAKSEIPMAVRFLFSSVLPLTSRILFHPIFYVYRLHLIGRCMNRQGWIYPREYRALSIPAPALCLHTHFFFRHLSGFTNLHVRIAPAFNHRQVVNFFFVPMLQVRLYCSCALRDVSATPTRPHPFHMSWNQQTMLPWRFSSSISRKWGGQPSQFVDTESR